MRWMWIDRVVELERAKKLVAVKNISLAEEHVHDHFEARPEGDGVPARSALPIHPASLIVEGMAQTAGIMVGHAEDFREKVILAKVSKCELDREAKPGQTLRYTAEMDSITEFGASTKGVVHLSELRADGTFAPWEEIGRIDLMFSHVDNNRSGLEFPEHNFVFGEGFKTLLRMSGVEIPGE